MNKKFLGIIAAGVAAVGSAIVAAPANASKAELPVTIEVKPGVFLRTYESLKFVVNTQDLQGGKSSEQVGVYDETGAIAPLPTTVPGVTPTDTVVKPVKGLYQVWGGTATTNVKIMATKATLQTAAAGGIGGGTETAEMSVLKGNDVAAPAPIAGQPFIGDAELQFKFSNANSVTAGRTYTGGQLTISVFNP